jgi:hypothetical protein
MATVWLFRAMNDRRADVVIAKGNTVNRNHGGVAQNIEVGVRFQGFWSLKLTKDGGSNCWTRAARCTDAYLSGARFRLVDGNATVNLNAQAHSPKLEQELNLNDQCSIWEFIYL